MSLNLTGQKDSGFLPTSNILIFLDLLSYFHVKLVGEFEVTQKVLQQEFTEMSIFELVYTITELSTSF